MNKPPPIPKLWMPPNLLPVYCIAVTFGFFTSKPLGYHLIIFTIFTTYASATTLYAKWNLRRAQRFLDWAKRDFEEKYERLTRP